MSTTTPDDVLLVAQDLFAAMVDGEPGTLERWPGPPADLADPVNAWVDAGGAQGVRTVLATDRTTAVALARSLLALGPDEPVEAADIRDVLGELVNVVSGNLKGTTPGAGLLGLPVVVLGPPAVDGALLRESHLRWRGSRLVISTWNLGTRGTTR